LATSRYWLAFRRLFRHNSCRFLRLLPPLITSFRQLSH
jgi:hypothetical protein